MTLIDVMLVGHWIEMRSVMGASRALEKLVELLPEEAHRLTDDGERGLGALPGREAEFRETFDQALEYAAGLGATMIHVMAGVVPDGTPVEACDEVFIANLMPSRGSWVELEIDKKGQVNVKATTTARMGHSGRGEGITAHAVALLLAA